MDILAGIYETHVQVRDLELAMEFYGRTLGLALGEVDDRGIAFYFVNGPGGARSLLGLWETADVSTSHFAFRVEAEHVDRMHSFLAERDIQVVEGRGIPATDQPLVHPWMPAASIYFDDPAGNQLELIADLSDAPRPDLDAMPLSEWRAEYT